AEREAIEESGWRPLGLNKMMSYYPSDGLSDQHFHLFRATGAEYLGPPTDISESERVEWHSPAQVKELLLDGQIKNGLSMTALLWTLSLD
ncbi:MAG: hypothetical protein V3V01_02655, partial [Acidimicrobiales bacterium]